MAGPRRELHDEVGQALTAVEMTLQGLRRQPGKQAPAQRIEEGIERVDRLLGAVRDLSLDLRPMLLDDLGLAAALHWYLKRVGERATLAVDLVCQPEEPAVPADVATTCVRLARGRLEVDSAPGAGTEIRAWLPLGPGEPQAGGAQR